ncbi:MAG: MFS-type transporter involved in bile tolerance (Atg22 family), partial [Dokdonia sp.]
MIINRCSCLTGITKLKMKKIGLLVVGLIVSIAMFANGTITGVVTENMDGKTEPVPFASVYLLGTTIGGMTDFDGNFQISAPVGS